jgi:hypothetical protein
MLNMSRACTFASEEMERTSSLRIKLATVFRKKSKIPFGVSLRMAAIKQMLYVNIGGGLGWCARNSAFVITGNIGAMLVK